METQTVYVKKIAYELRKRGFKIIGTKPNYARPELDCYIFERTPELISELKELRLNRK